MPCAVSLMQLMACAVSLLVQWCRNRHCVFFRDCVWQWNVVTCHLMWSSVSTLTNMNTFLQNTSISKARTRRGCIMAPIASVLREFWRPKLSFAVILQLAWAWTHMWTSLQYTLQVLLSMPSTMRFHAICLGTTCIIALWWSLRSPQMTWPQGAIVGRF